MVRIDGETTEPEEPKPKVYRGKTSTKGKQKELTLLQGGERPAPGGEKHGKRESHKNKKKMFKKKDKQQTSNKSTQYPELTNEAPLRKEKETWKLGKRIQ